METIGDGYQAICGHDNNTPDHAERMAHFAMSTVELVPLMQRIFKNSDFNIRLGIHSGPIHEPPAHIGRPLHAPGEGDGGCNRAGGPED